MNIYRAKTAGFCMGVSLALRALDKALQKKREQGRLIMFGPIIHNPQVLADYAEKGVLCFEKTDDLLPGDTVIIRAHGIPKHIEDEFSRKKLDIIDATCPKVKVAQNAIAKATAHGERLLLFGEGRHPEVRGLLSYAQGHSDVFVEETFTDTLQIAPDEPIVLASQTTQDKAIFEKISQKLAQKTQHLTILFTICDATERRQAEALSLAKRSDAMVVIGGKMSGNTKRLADIVRSVHIPVFQIETADKAILSQLKEYHAVGVTAGASTPVGIIDEVCKILSE